MQRICRPNSKKRKTNSWNMGNGILNPKAGGHTDTEQSNKALKNRGEIGSRSHNLVNLIGAERVSRRNFKYEGTYYITEDGEIYDKEYVETQKPHIVTGKQIGRAHV